MELTAVNALNKRADRKQFGAMPTATNTLMRNGEHCGFCDPAVLLAQDRDSLKERACQACETRVTARTVVD